MGERNGPTKYRKPDTSPAEAIRWHLKMPKMRWEKFQGKPTIWITYINAWINQNSVHRSHRNRLLWRIQFSSLYTYNWLIDGHICVYASRMTRNIYFVGRAEPAIVNCANGWSIIRGWRASIGGPLSVWGLINYSITYVLSPSHFFATLGWVCDYWTKPMVNSSWKCVKYGKKWSISKII